MAILQLLAKDLPQFYRSRLVVGSAWAVLAAVLFLFFTGCASIPYGNLFSRIDFTGNDGPARVISVSGSSATANRGNSDNPLPPSEITPDAILAATEQVMVEIYERVTPSVVQIRAVTQLDQPRSRSPFGTKPDPPLR